MQQHLPAAGYVVRHRVAVLLHGGGLLAQEGPVKDKVPVEGQRLEERAEVVSVDVVIGQLVETQVATGRQVEGEFWREAAAEGLNGSRDLLFVDTLVLLLLGGGLKKWKKGID